MPQISPMNWFLVIILMLMILLFMTFNSQMEKEVLLNKTMINKKKELKW